MSPSLNTLSHPTPHDNSHPDDNNIPNLVGNCTPFGAEPHSADRSDSHHPPPMCVRLPGTQRCHLKTGLWLMRPHHPPPYSSEQECPRPIRPVGRQGAARYG